MDKTTLGIGFLSILFVILIGAAYFLNKRRKRRVKLVAWQQVEKDFWPDGSLRELHVLECALSDWQRLWEYLLESALWVRFTVDGEVTQPPALVSEVFAFHEKASPGFNMNLSGIDIVCHFFTEEEIEFDLWPEDVQGEESWHSLQSFMVAVGDLLAKPVLLTMEGSSEPPVIVSYNPSARAFTYCPADVSYHGKWFFRTPPGRFP
jgi:hypothetical protein